MAITLGQRQITVEDKIELIQIILDKLNSSGNQQMIIKYKLNDEYFEETLNGYEFYDFYMNKWLDARPIFNNTSIREKLTQDIDLETAENQIVEGLPTESK
jgi:hypothetical protein